MADVQRTGVRSAMRASLRLRKMGGGTAGTLSQVHIAGNGEEVWWWRWRWRLERSRIALCRCALAELGWSMVDVPVFPPNGQDSPTFAWLG